MGWIERQLPAGDEMFLDHVGWFVPDIEGCAAGFERLGFTVSPVNIHYSAGPDGGLAKSGTANRLITFGLGYLEILAAVADTPLADQLKEGLARYTGLHLVALTHADMDSQVTRLTEQGLPPQPVVHLRREVETDDGPKTVRATVVRAQPGSMPEGRVQMLAHGTPELIWRDGFCSHPNAVDALTDMLVVEADPLEAVARFERFCGRKSVGEGAFDTIPFDRGRLTFVDPPAACRLLPGLDVPSLPFEAAVALRSADLAVTRAALEAGGGEPLVDRDDVICVGPSDGLGAYLVFHAHHVESVWERLGG